jgi:hypothetical protein
LIWGWSMVAVGQLGQEIGLNTLIAKFTVQDFAYVIWPGC